MSMVLYGHCKALKGFVIRWCQYKNELRRHAKLCPIRPARPFGSFFLIFIRFKMLLWNSTVATHIMELVTLY